jgi:hypothetical protein
MSQQWATSSLQGSYDQPLPNPQQLLAGYQQVRPISSAARHSWDHSAALPHMASPYGYPQADASDMPPPSISRRYSGHLGQTQRKVPFRSELVGRVLSGDQQQLHPHLSRVCRTRAVTLHLVATYNDPRWRHAACKRRAKAAGDPVQTRPSSAR